MARTTSLTIDLGESLRRIKSDKYRAQLNRRAPEALVAGAEIAGARRAALLLDINVYIHAAAGTLPAAAAVSVDRELLFNCPVCVAELATGVAHADPARIRWPRLREHYQALIARLPPTRLLTPDAQIWTDAGVIAGTLLRCQGYQRTQRPGSANNAPTYLTLTKISYLTAQLFTVALKRDSIRT